MEARRHPNGRTGEGGKMEANHGFHGVAVLGTDIGHAMDGS